MKLSLCTSLYNSQEYLDIFLQSIESQSYKNWELLICNDCSQDKTLEYLKNKKKIYTNFFISNNKNNLGLTRSLINLIKEIDENGFIVRLDDDEIHTSEYLISIASLFKKEHDLIVYTEFPLIGNLITRIHSKNKLLSSLFLAFIGNIGSHGATSFTKSLYQKAGGYDKSFYLSQDYHLLIRLIKNAEKPIFVNSLNFKPFEIPRRINKLSLNESFMQKIFSLIAVSAIFPKETHKKYSTYVLFIILLIISIPIKFARSLICKFI